MECVCKVLIFTGKENKTVNMQLGNSYSREMSKTLVLAAIISEYLLDWLTKTHQDSLLIPFEPDEHLYAVLCIGSLLIFVSFQHV